MKELRFLRLAYGEDEKKAQARYNSSAYLGQDLERHAGMSIVLMDGSLLHGGVGERNFEGGVGEGFYSRVSSRDSGAKGLTRNCYLAQNEIKTGVFSEIQSVLKPENRYYSANPENADFSNVLKARTTCTLEDESQGDYTLSGGEGSGTTTNLTAHACNGESEVLCGFTNQEAENGEWSCVETKNCILDDMLMDVQTYSELPLHENVSDTPESDLDNVGRWFIGENYEVKTMNIESLSGLSSHEDLISRQNVQFNPRTPEDPSALMETRAHHLQTWGHLQATSTSRSSLAILKNPTSGSFSGSAQIPGMQTLKSTSPVSYIYGSSSLPAFSSVTFPILENCTSLPFMRESDHCMTVQSNSVHSSIHNNRSASSEVFESQVKVLPFSGVPASESHNQTLLAVSAICLDSSNESLAQDKSINQNCFASDCSGELPYPYGRHRRTHDQIMPQQSNICELPAQYHPAGNHGGQFQPAFPSFMLAKQFDQGLGENSRAGAIWQRDFQLEPVIAEYSLASEQHDPGVRFPQTLPFGFFSNEKRYEHAASEVHSAIIERTENVTEEGIMLVNQLLQVVEALDTGNPDGAHSILARLKQYPLSRTQYIQRLTHFLREQLAARLVFAPLSSYRNVSPIEFLQRVSAHKSFCEASPFVNFAHFVANQAILDALEGEESIHVIDFGISFGGQWAVFLQDFALKPGKPRRLRITAVGLKKDEMDFAGERLCSFAKEQNIILHFQTVVTKPESVTIEMLPVRDKDPVAVNFVLSLQKLLEECPTSLDPLLKLVKRLSPRVVTVVDKELSDDSPHLRRRFFEALNYYSYLSDLLGAGNLDKEVVMSIENLLLWPDLIDLAMYNRFGGEKEYKSFRQWRHHFVSAGFSNVPLSKLAEMNAQFLIRESSSNEGYSILKNEGSILLNWRGKTLLSASSWTC